MRGIGFLHHNLDGSSVFVVAVLCRNGLVVVVLAVGSRLSSFLSRRTHWRLGSLFGRHSVVWCGVVL